MLRQQALGGLQAQLDTAVTAGDTETARKVASDLAKLEASLAPKAPPFGDAEIRAELDKQDWFGTDPKKSKAAIDFGKTMDPKKFPTAEAFAAAVIKAVDAEFKPAVAADEPEDEPDGEPEEPAAPKKRKTDAPGDGDALGTPRRASSGPWVKMSDAPNEIRAEIKRTADKFAPKTKEGREAFEKRALEAHFAAHQRSKAAGKK